MASETQNRKLSCFPLVRLVGRRTELHHHGVKRKGKTASGRTISSKEIFAKSSVVKELNGNAMKTPKSNSNTGKNSNFSAFLRRFKFCNKSKEYSDGKKDGGETEELCSYEMNQDSEILSVSDVNLLGQRLPPIAIGNPWKLAFSTTKDGFCLQSLYRKMSLYSSDTPVLLIIQDTRDRVFGVLASNTLRPSHHFYGTSQTFLFQISPAFQMYKWNGDNFYFIKGNMDSIIFGSGNGKFGIWLDGDLNKGRTESCQTFDSPPLVPEEDFTVRTIECWTFEKYKTIINGFGDDSIWISSYPTENSLIMDKSDMQECDGFLDRSLSSSARSKAEQEIVNDYVVKLTDELRTAFHCQFGGECKPELIIGRSEILDIEDVERIIELLSGKKYQWYLSFSTLLNGNSLDTFYAKASHGTGTTLIIIKDTQKRVFGALLSHPPGLSTDFYGGKDSLVFQLRPEFKVHKWAEDDTKFLFGGKDVFRVGAPDGSGNSALMLPSKLTEGWTGACSTFGSPALVPESEFQIKILECWHFEPHVEG